MVLLDVCFVLLLIVFDVCLFCDVCAFVRCLLVAGLFFDVFACCLACFVLFLLEFRLLLCRLRLFCAAFA